MIEQTSSAGGRGSDLHTSNRLHIRLLGGAELQSNGVPLRRTRSRTETWLLAVLLLRTNQNVERSWLAGIFWPDSSEAQAFNNLRRSLSNLRQVLGEESYRLVSPTPQTIAFDLTDASCDVTSFDNALAQKDAPSLRHAVELYRGPLLPDCENDWIIAERRTREQGFLTALETLAGQAMRDAAPTEAIGYLRQVLRIEPFRESTNRLLMEALAALGDKAGLTLAYRQLRLLLHDQLQSEPSAETRDLYQRLQESLTNPVPSSRPISDSEFPTENVRPTLRIPWPVGDLIGRERETPEVAALIVAHRLVTLTGSGGIGKTRLALAVAPQVVTNFPDGVWFVDLQAVIDPAQVAPAIVHVLEVRESKEDSSSTDALRKHLQGRRLLLILDNAEHVREACATLVAALLKSLPDLHILVTSRMPINVGEEVVWRVPSLAVPEERGVAALQADALLEYAAPRLFVTRALAASSTFVLTDTNAPAISRICARLDGIPLALELAAARTASLSTEQIGARLEDAFRLLTTGPWTAFPRQQTLRAMVDWSYTLLTHEQQRAFCQFACFIGGWTLEAAEALVGEDAADYLAVLIAQSLVIMEMQPDGQPRYRMLETLRQYGQEKLREAGEQKRAQEGHRRYFVQFAQQNFPNRNGAEQVRALERLTVDYANLRLALQECLAEREAPSTGRWTDGLEIAASLWRVWEARGDAAEGRAFLATLLAHPDAQAEILTRAHVLNGAGILAQLQSDYAEATSLQEQSLSLFRKLGDRESEAKVVGQLGVVLLRQGNHTEAALMMTRSLEMQRSIADSWGMALTLANLGVVARRQGDYKEAIAYLEESLALRYALGDREGIIHALGNLGIIHFEHAEYDVARRVLEECLALNRIRGSQSDIANNLGDLGLVAMEQGDYLRARQLQEESLLLRRKMGDRWGIALALGNLGATALLQGDYPNARLYQQESLALRRALNDREGIAFALANLGDQSHQEGEFEQAYTQHTESLALFRAVENNYGVAFLLVNLGDDCRALQRWEEARDNLTSCLKLIQGTGSHRLLPDVLEALARLAFALGQTERASALYGSATAQRYALAVPRVAKGQEDYVRAQAELRNQLPETAIAQATAQGESLSLAQVFDFALETGDLTRSEKYLVVMVGSTDGPA